ncbi:BON domain-containing protein [Streptomyces sp. NPDC004779]
MPDRPERYEPEASGPEPHEPATPGPEPYASPAPGPEPYADDYRIALLRERLAVGGQAELGVRAERRGGVVLLTGTVPNASRRDEILDLARSTLTGCAVRTEIAVAGRDAPDHGENLP